MSMTKKQLAALQRIIKREQAKYCDDAWEANKFRDDHKLVPAKQAGAHPSCDHYVVTDGKVAVIFCKKPDGMPVVERMDGLYDAMSADIECSDKSHDHFLALTVTADHIKEWKKLSKDWKAGKTQKTGAVPVKLTAETTDGGTVGGFYDPRYVLDAVEAVGPGAMLYIGRYSKFSFYCSLLVFPKNWAEMEEHTTGYVLPLRIT